MDNREIKKEMFGCSKIGKKVVISRNILLHRSSSTGDIDIKVTTSIDCDQKYNCGIGTSSGLITTLDWKNCVHPDMKQ